MRRILLIFVAVGIAACDTQQEAGQAGEMNEAQTEPAEVASANTALYSDAVASPSRLQSDYERDAGRKPGQVLEFFGVAPGMTVLDMFSGGGYYTEIISRVVGESGRVVAHTNKAYIDFVKDEFAARHADGRLPNVDVLMAENNELALPEAEFDAIMLVLSFHDLYYEDADGGWPRFDVPAFLAELRKGLKDDGFIAIIDHQAEPGSPSETGGTVHRIDSALVIDVMQEAGFQLTGQSDLLRSADDDYSKNVFAPEIRGKTDRFILKFSKSG